MTGHIVYNRFGKKIDLKKKEQAELSTVHFEVIEDTYIKDMSSKRKQLLLDSFSKN